jgi:O-antigen/teichoic acid export membrane protein
MQESTLKSQLVENLPAFLRPWWAKLEASPLGYRLASGAFWGLMGASISRGLGLLASILVARMLGKVGFGELGIIQNTAGMFGLFAGFGMGITATKHVAEFRGSDPRRAGRIIALSSIVAWTTGAIMTVALAISASWLAQHTLAAPHLSGVLRIGSLLLLLGAVCGAQTGALAGFEAFKRIAQINFYSGLTAFPLMVGGVWWLGLEGAVWALVVSQAVNSLLNYLALRREAENASVHLDYAGCGYEFHVLWKFSLPAVLTGAISGPVYWLCSTLLVNRPDGYSEMGIYNAANQWFNALLFLPGVLGQAVLPMLAEQMGKDDHVRSARVLLLSTKMNGVAMLPVVFIGCLASPVIMASYGSSFRGAWPTLVVVLLTAGLIGIITPIGQTIVAGGRFWLGSIMNLGWAICFLVFTFLLLRWGAFGVATARLLAYFIHSTWTFAFAIHLLRRSKCCGTH